MIPEQGKSPALPLVQMSGPTPSGGGGGGGGEGGGAGDAPPPQAEKSAVKLNTQKNLANAFMLLVQVWRQPGDLRVLWGDVRGFSEEARTRGFPSLSFGGLGLIGVASDLSIGAG
ncbi:protein of unknown function [uncultured Woeseiaceae bacterium]|uniref:Uncharacterized protein n=1 Tax=uncultured Woeseiaceae bacterium TaxID=1983305 RepID=A0A7D9H4D9_9GAMM|nr:protein of unknown function [uncultured Woeseiaceae bacterium]